jgi:hypothetical protein
LLKSAILLPTISQTRQQERIVPINRGKFLAKAVKLGADKGQVKGSIVTHDDGIIQPKAQLASDLSETLYIRQFYFGQAIQTRCAGRERFLAVYVSIEGIEVGVPSQRRNEPNYYRYAVKSAERCRKWHAKNLAIEPFGIHWNGYSMSQMAAVSVITKRNPSVGGLHCARFPEAYSTRF